MRTCLQLRVGPYPILLDADRVLEILDLASEDAGLARCREWRGQALAAVNARAVFGVEDLTLPARHPGVVYCDGTSAPPIMLEIDRVESLLKIDPDGLLPLPPTSPQALHWFDGVWPDAANGGSLYHLRPDLSDGDFGLARPMNQ